MDATTPSLSAEMTVDQAIALHKELEVALEARKAERHVALNIYQSALKRMKLQLQIDGVSGVDLEELENLDALVKAGQRTNTYLDARDADEISNFRAQIVKKYFSA